MTIEEIEKEIEESKKRQEFLLKELENLKNPKFEKGKWYFTKDNSWNCEYLVRVTGYIHQNQLWYTEMYCINDNSEIYINLIHDWVSMSTRNFQPATKKQIQKILIEVAKKKGYKNGVKYNSVNPNSLGVCTFHSIEKLQFCENLDNREKLTDWSCGSIYFDGKWAEIIKNDLPILNNKEGKIENNQVVYGCQRYNIEDVYNLDKTIKTFNITGNLNLNGYSVTPSQIEKVVEYLNENNL